MNADLLAPGSNVFYLTGTIGEHVPTTVVGLLSFPKCVIISCERSSHTQLCCDCPVERLTFPIVCTESPTSKRCPSPPPTVAVGSGAVATDVKDCLRPRASIMRRRMTPNILKLHLSIHKTPFPTASLSEKVVQYQTRGYSRAQGLGLAVRNRAPSSQPAVRNRAPFSQPAVRNRALPLHLAMRNRAAIFF